MTEREREKNHPHGERERDGTTLDRPRTIIDTFFKIERTIDTSERHSEEERYKVTGISTSTYKRGEREENVC